MAKAVLICGKICCGKSTYAEQLRQQMKAVVLSCDEITLALFGQHIGEDHDLYVERTQTYLYWKAAQILQTGINVILDWGFWMKSEREEARAFFNARGLDCEFHYIDIAPQTWEVRREKRNRAVAAGQTEAYYVDAPLARKFENIFEPPQKEEIDLWLYA